ncbi:hypothetical protein MRS76_01960 [Rhizobiaceae bacterium n13]|uniref:Uncharacterized protein n=1 Tax=Ferirhizobium litorale TaxID=2927786 RepID=A0AAE3QBC9_9HYPH|nr:hypothetical protein [Fererhizobium litorale]MDI7860710.1 hypothetical protein [Fererhizobium litorale]MDI7920858.1 hypothetical protein [Fererhizobium litorale]
MNSDRPEGIMMIGLHKLAAQNGDGLIPELFALLTECEQLARERPNVVDFPVWSARLPGEAPEHELGTDDGDRVVAFRAAAGETSDKRRKV